MVSKTFWRRCFFARGCPSNHPSSETFYCYCLNIVWGFPRRSEIFLSGFSILNIFFFLGDLRLVIPQL